MVCMGNICRSPLAEGILRHKINEQIQLGNQKFSTWIVDSAGTSEFHVSEKPDSRSIKVAKENGIDITQQRSRQFSALDFKNFDVIYVMDSSNYHNVLGFTNSEEEKAKVKLIMNELEPGINIQVLDPYYHDHDFINVFEMLNKVCEVIIRKN